MPATPATMADYRARAVALRDKARRDLGRSHLGHGEFVDWLIEHRRGLAPATWGLYRRACVVELRDLATRSAHATAALLPLAARLEATPEDPAGPPEARTSAKKAKYLPPADFDKILAEIHRRRSQMGNALKDFLISTLMSGLRPCEWDTATLMEPREPGAPHLLHVRCAKHSPERALETRTLAYDELTDEAAAALRNWMTCVQAAVESESYDRLIATLSRLMRRVVCKVFPRRGKRPCPYSARHEALSNFKAEYIETHSDPQWREAGAAVVATLAGHISDLSATQYYARARKGGTRRWPIPRAVPEEVANVRKRLGARRAKFESFLAGCANVKKLK